MNARYEDSDSVDPRRTPYTTPEERDANMINLAYDQAEMQLRSGTAPAPIVQHFLKLGDERYGLELDLMRAEHRLREKKIEQIDSAAEIKELYERAQEAMLRYQGDAVEEYYDDEDYYD